MNLTFAPLFSGSSGNALYVGAGETHILVDAGVSAIRLTEQMHRAGQDPNRLNALLVTHEHSDHVSGVGVMSRKFNLPIYATEGTWRSMRHRLGALSASNIRVVRAGLDFYIGRVNVMPFEIPHDAAEPVGYSFTIGGLKCAVATDIGCIKDGWLDEVSGADVLLLEANHDVDMLRAGRYPYDLKKRILSRRGHLSNEDCGKACAMLHERGVRHIILGHLSAENNVPELAMLTVENALREVGIQPGAMMGLSVARKTELSGVFSLLMGGDVG